MSFNRNQSFNMHIASSDIFDALSIAKLYQTKTANNPEDYKAVKDIIAFHKTLKNLTDTLTLEEHFAFAKILNKTRDKLDASHASLCLQSLKNLFGTKTLTILAQAQPKTVGAFKIISQAIQTPIKKLSAETLAHEAKESKHTVRCMPCIPRQIAPEDLQEDGWLKITYRDEIKNIIYARIAAGQTTGRLTKAELAKILHHKPNFSAIYQVNKDTDQLEIYWIYKGAKHTYIDKKGKPSQHGRLAGKGAYGSVKLLQKDDDGEWFVLKIKAKNSEEKKESNTEYKVSKLVKLARGKIVRYSPSHDRQQEEIIMKWLPGEELLDVTQERRPRPLLYWIEVVLGMIKQVMDFHELGYLHRDIKGLNFLLHANAVKLIDFGFAIALPLGQRSVVTNLLGTIGYVAPEILTDKEYSESTEIFALGVVIADIFNFITRESIREAYKVGRGMLTFEGFTLRGGYQTVTPYSTEFYKRDVITNISERAEILGFTRKMLGSPNERPDSLKICYDFFEKIYHNLLATTTHEIGVINADQLANISSQAGNQLMKDAKDFYSVRFFEPKKKYSQKDLAEIRVAFEDKQIMINNDLINLNGTSITELPQLLETAAKQSEPEKKFRFTLITTQSI